MNTNKAAKKSRRRFKKPINMLREEFYSAPNDALLDRKTVAAGICCTVECLENHAFHNTSIPYIKVLSRRCLYKKADVLDWLNKNSSQKN